METMTYAVTNRVDRRDERRALAIGVAGIPLVVAAWVVPSDGDVNWGGVLGVVGFGALSCAVAFGWLLPRWSKLEPRSIGKRALATSVIAAVTIPLLWIEAEPFPLLAVAAVLGRAAQRQGQRSGSAAVLVAVIGLLCAATLALLGITDVLPEWPPRNWHGGS